MQHTRQSSGESTPRIQVIDALRGFAALLVLVAHILLTISTGDLAALKSLLSIFDLGQFGVCLFFVISGYIIPFSLDRLPLKIFWQRRFFRLYPIYWFNILCILLIAVLNIAIPYSPQYQDQPVRMALANLTMLQIMFGYDNLIGIYWSLSYEMLFYIAMSILILLQIAQRSVGIAAVVFVIAFIHDVILIRIGFGLPIEMSLFCLMCLGHILFRVSQQRVNECVAIWYMILLAALFFATTTPFVMSMSRSIAAFVFYVMMRRQWQPRAMVWLGAISYPLYLMHELVIAVLKTGSPFLDAVLWFGGSILVAWIIHRTMELPFQRLGRTLQQRS